MHVAPLRPEEFRPAYAVVRTASPEVSLSAWLLYARRTARPVRGRRRGILGARRDGLRHPCGLLCWRCDADLLAGWTLTTDYAVAVDVLEPDAVLLALLSAFQEIAEELGCGATRHVVGALQAPLAARLVVEGHRPVASLLSQPLPFPRKREA